MRYFILLFTIVYSLNISAQIDLYDIQFPLNTLESAHSFYEDKDGMLWQDSKYDFARYTGQKFEHKNIDKILGNKYTIKKNGNSIYYWDNSTLKLYSIVSKDIKIIFKFNESIDLDFFYVDKKNQTWVFTKTIDKSKRDVYKINNKNELTHFFDLYNHIGVQDVYAPYDLRDINNLFYFHFKFGALVIINPKKKERVELEVVNKQDFKNKLPYSVFRIDNKNNIWRFTYDTFEIYDPKTKAFVKHPLSGNVTTKNNSPKKPGLNLAIRFIYTDSKNNVWLGFEDSNLMLFNIKDHSLVNFKEVLVKELGNASGDINFLYEDKQGNFWGHKRGGIFKIRKKENLFKSYLINTDDPNHKLYTYNPSFSNKISSYFGKEKVLSFSAKPIFDDLGNTYLQSQRYSHRILSKNNSLELIPWFHNKGKQYLFNINAGKIYTIWQNYYRINKDLKTIRIPYPDNFPLRSLKQVFQQKNGKIWASGLLETGQYFIANLNPESLQIELIDNLPELTTTFTNHQIYNLNEDDKGNLLLSSSAGLYIFNNKQKLIKLPEYKMYKNDSIGFVTFETFLKQTKGNTGWLKNNKQIGLLNLETNTLIHYLTNNDLEVKRINDVLPMSNNEIWYTSDSGIGYYNFENNTKAFFDKTHTLVKKFYPVTLTKNPTKNEIVATSINGTHLFNPDSLLAAHAKYKENIKKTPLILNEYSYFENDKDTVSKFIVRSPKVNPITLNYNDKFLSFNFELINYNYNNRHRYKTKLEGYDKDWKPINRDGTITYSSLPSGKYTLKVKGSIGDNIWSDNELSIPIKIKEAWYKTWLFYFIMFLLLALIVYTVTRNYYNIKLKQKEEIEKLRTKISIDLHDDVGSILTGLSMQSEILGYKAKDEDKIALNRISELSRSAMLRMRDAVWAMDSRKNNWKSLLDRMNEFAAETLELKNISYQIKYNSPDLNKSLNNVVRQNLYLIYKEAVTNILKHSNANNVIVDLQENNGKLEMAIKDNGNIKPKISSSGLGLSNMMERAKQINSQIHIKQDNGFGIFLKPIAN